MLPVRILKPGVRDARVSDVPAPQLVAGNRRFDARDRIDPASAVVMMVLVGFSAACAAQTAGREAFAGRRP